MIRFFRPLCALLVPAVYISLASASKPLRPYDSSSQIIPPSKHYAPGYSSTATSTTLDTYSFDDSLGQPDPQGWTTMDLTVQADTFFHVDDFSGLAPDYAPLEGSQSLWCGVRGTSCSSQHYASAPGYGDNWGQLFVSIPLTVTGDATISYKIRYDTEAGYDYVYLEYRTVSQRWEPLFVYDGVGEAIDFATAPAESLSGSVRFRFRFTSDGSCSDEDGDCDGNGAILIDSLTVSDAGGVVDFQDFESEPVGALSTLDGHWSADVSPPFGDYAALVSGDTVLQEDPAVTDSTHFWAFFNGSPDLYECGLKNQPAIPHHLGQNSNESIYNMAVSPWMDLTPYYGAQGASTSQDTVFLSYDIYYDMPVDYMVLWDWGFRFQLAGSPCPTPWAFRKVIYYYWPQFKWDRNTESELIPQGAIAVQVAVGVTDIGPAYGSSNCHHHAPLYDNVEVGIGFASPTGTQQPSRPAGFALYQNHPNPFNPSTAIPYYVPREGAWVRIAVYDVTGRLVKELVKAEMPQGRNEVVWNGRDESGKPVSSGIYFYRMQADGFERTLKMVFLQ